MFDNDDFFDISKIKSKKIKLKTPKENDTNISTSHQNNTSFNFKITTNNGFKINGKQFIVKSTGFYETGGLAKDGTKNRLTKEAVGKGAASALSYINRSDSVQDIQKNEEESLVYNMEKQLSSTEFIEKIDEYKQGKEAFHHLVISPGQDLSRDEMISLARNTLAKFQEKTGKKLECHFAFHTDKGRDEEGKFINSHIHVIAVGSKSDVRFTPAQLQEFKVIACQETVKKLIDKHQNSEAQQLFNSLKRDEEFLVKLKISEALNTKLYEERKKIVAEETVLYKIKMREINENSKIFSREDLEIFKEMQSVKGNRDYVSRTDATNLYEKEFKQQTKNIDSKIKELGEDKYKKFLDLKNQDKETFEKYSGALKYKESKKDEEKAEKWIKSFDQKYKDLDPEDLKKFNKIEFQKEMKKELESKTHDQFKAEKLAKIDAKLDVLNSKLTDKDIEKNIDSFIEKVKELPEMKNIKEIKTEERVSFAGKTGREIEERTGFKNKEETMKEKEREKHKDMKISVDATVDALLKSKETLEKDYYTIRNEVKDEVSEETKEEVKDAVKMIEQGEFKRVSEAQLSSENDQEAKEKLKEISKDAKEFSIGIANERNKAKSASGEESDEFRSLQKQFMILKIVENDGLQDAALEKWKKNRKENISEENADQFIKNNKEFAKELVDAGILKESGNDFSFVDDRAKEILFENFKCEISVIANKNLEDMKMQMEANNKDFGQKIDEIKQTETQKNTNKQQDKKAFSL